MHMLYANGTFDSSLTVNPTVDQGFFSRLSSAITERVDAAAGSDLTGGVGTALTAKEKQEEADASGGETTALAAEGTISQQAGQSDDVPTITRTYIDYPATAGGAFFPGQVPQNFGDSDAYADSMQQGVDSTTEQMRALSTQCPESTFFLVGYSQGAEVMDNIARQIGAGQGPVSADRISGVSLVSSPVRAQKTPLQVLGQGEVGTGDIAQATAGLNNYPTPKGGGLGYDKNGHPDYGTLSDRTISWCLNGDIVCGMPVESTLARNIAAALQEVDLVDPVNALDRMAEGMNQAVAVSDVKEADISDVDFGDQGLDLARGAAEQQPEAPFNQYARETNRDSTTGPLSGSTSTLSATPTTTTDSAVVEAPLESRVVDVLGDLGGMALGAGITTVKNTLTPENIAQVGMAGVAGGPQAAGALSLVKLSESGRELLEPENASQYVRPALESLEENGFVEGELAELAVTLANWKGLAEHGAYYERPMVADGRTAMEVTADWAVAAAGETTGTPSVDSDEVVSDAIGGLGETTESVEFDTDTVKSGLRDVVQASVAVAGEQGGQ